MSGIIFRTTSGILNKTFTLSMRKVALFAFMFAFATLVFSSCKSHERCPAYGKVNTSSAQKAA
jgi:hypothetical protein